MTIGPIGASRVAKDFSSSPPSREAILRLLRRRHADTAEPCSPIMPSRADSLESARGFIDFESTRVLPEKISSPHGLRPATDHPCFHIKARSTFWVFPTWCQTSSILRSQDQSATELPLPAPRSTRQLGGLANQKWSFAK